MNDCKHYKPGDEGFDEIAATLTHPSKIKGERKRLILVEESCYHKGRRNESSGKV